MPKKKNNPGFVTQSQCDTKYGKMNLALFGSDGRGGIVKDISDIKNQVASTSKEVTDFVKDHKEEMKTKGRDWRALGFTILASLVGGTTVGIILTLLRHFLNL